MDTIAAVHPSPAVTANDGVADRVPELAAVSYARHPASRVDPDLCPAYLAERRHHPSDAAWSARSRFAPPGPVAVDWPVLTFAYAPMAGPSWAAAPALADKAAVPYILLDEQPVLDALEALQTSGLSIHPAPGGAAGLEDADRSDEAREEAMSAAFGTAAAGAAANWGSQPKPRNAFSRPNIPLSEFFGPRRRDQPRAWLPGPADSDGQTRRAAAPVWTRRSAIAPVAAACVAAVLGAAAAHIFPRGRAAAPVEVQAVFNAPMLVLRSATGGRVDRIMVRSGQKVQAFTPVMALSSFGDGQKDTAVSRPVLAGVDGLVRSVEIEPGREIPRGTALIRMFDCGHPFLTMPPNTPLQPGDAVNVALPTMAAVPGFVRRSAGPAEPANSVVVTLTANALSGNCPIGATALVRAIPPPQ